MSPSLLFSRLSLAALFLTLAACSGGDGGTSSGTGADENDVVAGVDAAGGEAINDVDGSYTGQMVFSNDETSEITIIINNNGVVTAQANTTGQSTEGQLESDLTFESTGTITFIFQNSVCTGITEFSGGFATETTIEGTFTSSPACAVNTGGTELLELDGFFNADFDDIQS